MIVNGSSRRYDLKMARRFVNVDRDTPMLFPPDMRDWVRKDDMFHFVIEAVEQMDLRVARVNERGSGSEQYPPSMMTALLIYSYAHGIFSSRKIETASYRDVAVRYLTGDTHPDHDTIATFRRRNRELFEQCFVQVLAMAGEVGVLQVGTVRHRRDEAGGQREQVQKRELQAMRRAVAAFGGEGPGVGRTGRAGRWH